jgi:glycine reductase complex component B subunit gamma
MSPKKMRVVHYLNQFFGQVGQEEKAGVGFLIKEGPVGPGVALQNILGERGKVVATIVCGDNYFSENIQEAAEAGLRLIEPYAPDLLLAGPAFESGRYGMACGAICKSVQARLKVPAITGMFDENPGVNLYRGSVYICRTDRNALKMVEALTRMVHLGLKLTSDEEGDRLVSRENIGRPSEDRYFPRGILKNEYTEKIAAERSIDMLMAKISGKPFRTEAEGPKAQPIKPPPPIRKNLSQCEIALISDGGLIPKGNPDGFRTRGNTLWARYPIDEIMPVSYTAGNHEIAHGGYFNVHVLENANRLVPVDILRELEKEREVGKLHPFLYSTSGNATIQDRCREMGEEIAEELKQWGVDGAIHTST